ncbi:MAG TPA: glycosyltransferase family 2 protein [Lactovum miscens]|uniref:glycosyltransferase family 2 protein n=1 Tax=Lactovum miscens TaxID=190387 RepID=UPI002ED804BA
MIKILMSTYNGEKYVAEQIKSILNQSIGDIQIFVRDDGSSDSTVEILREFVNRGEIILFEGENIGYSKSFFKLMQSCGDSDFFAFCDQDDVWLPDKLKLASKKMITSNQDKPTLYYSNYAICDSNLNKIGNGYSNPRPNFSNILLQCPTNGFTIVFNNCLRKKYLKSQPEHSLGHDFWLCLLAVTFGEILFDNEETALWRRSSSSVTNENHEFFHRLIYALSLIKNNNYFNKLTTQLQEFFLIYREEMTESQRQRVIPLIKERSFFIQFRKVFFCGRYSWRMQDELFLRFSMLLGML